MIDADSLISHPFSAFFQKFHQNFLKLAMLGKIVLNWRLMASPSLALLLKYF